MMESASHPAGTTVLVTGASSGIGRACCVRLAREGVRLVLTGRDAGRLAETASACAGEGHLCFPADLTDAGAVSALVESSPSLAGVVHAAGVCDLRPIRFEDAGHLSAVLASNLVAPLALTAALLKRRKIADAASLVFIGSVAAENGASGMSAYAASKGGLHAAVRALALELAPRRIRVNTVAAGSVHTPLLDALCESLPENSRTAIEAAHPLGIGRPEDVAAAVAYLVSPDARWVTGSTLTLDGGYSAR